MYPLYYYIIQLFTLIQSLVVSDFGMTTAGREIDRSVEPSIAAIIAPFHTFTLVNL